MKLLKKRVNKPGLERFYDVYLVWQYKGKVYDLLIKPTFNDDYKLLLINAKEVPMDEPLEKYL